MTRGAVPAPAPAADRSARRWEPADVTRGFAMVLVVLSHFFQTWFKGHPSGAADLLDPVTMAATPTFFLLSGAMLGLASSAPGEAPSATWRRCADRGLFLLLVAHPLIFLAHVPRWGGITAASRIFFATDTIGVCLLLVPGIVLALRPPLRAAVAVALLGASWWVVGAWAARGDGAVAKELLFGTLRPRAVAYAFPLVPWLAMYLAGTIAGERLRVRRARGPAEVSRFAARLGIASMGLGLASYAAHRGIRGALLLWTMTAPGSKVPPSPAFLLFYGGVALIALAGAVEADRRSLLEGARRVLALLGRNSLFAFVAQYFVCAALLLVRGGAPAAWPAGLVASLAAVVGATAAWDRLGGHRWITVGLRPRPTPVAELAPVGAPAESP